MTRKVVKHGKSTYIISLPVKWVRRYGVRQGDELQIREEKNALCIYFKDDPSGFRMEIDGSKMLPFLVDRLMARSYQKGYDEIIFTHNNPALVEVIKKKVHELIGYEIVEQDHRRCVIKAIAAKIELDFDNSLKKAFFIVKQMMEECRAAYTAGDKAALDNIEYKDLQVNRLCYFCLRQISKEHYESKERTQQLRVLYYLIEILEDLGDAVKKLAKQLAYADKKEVMEQLLALIVREYTLAQGYFYAPEVEKANQAWLLHQEIRKKIEEAASQTLSRYGILGLMLIQEITGIVYHFTTMRLDYLKAEQRDTIT